ncbi:hypothetical protein I352_01287 [Cryptococcus deuterogattii MMRL2647]|nr:hypothetical protein I352_01287 [Cryptococcus deuterogattii MMRL2647]
MMGGQTRLGGDRTLAVVSYRYKSWRQAQEKSKRRSTPVFHLPHKYRETISIGFRLPCGHASLEDRPVGLFRPIAKYAKGMMDWDAAQKMDASYIPFYKLQRTITGVRYRNLFEYLDAASTTAFDSSLQMEGMGFDFTQEIDAFETSMTLPAKRKVPVMKRQ